MHDPSWQDDGEFDDRLDEELSERIRPELDPTEYLLWVDRPLPLPALRVPAVPALFVSVIAGLSGFSLAAMFGLLGEDWLDVRTMLLALGLGPCVLGGLIGIHSICLLVRRWLKQRRLSRLIYAVTDHRAIVARTDGPDGLSLWWSLGRGQVLDTRRFENGDGSGDLFFLGAGIDPWLPFGFLEVPRVGFVESLVHEALVDHDQEWWKFGTAGAS
jgi:hypothetical protein